MARIFFTTLAYLRRLNVAIIAAGAPSAGRRPTLLLSATSDQLDSSSSYGGLCYDYCACLEAWDWLQAFLDERS